MDLPRLMNMPRLVDVAWSALSRLMHVSRLMDCGRGWERSEHPRYDAAHDETQSARPICRASNHRLPPLTTNGAKDAPGRN